MGFQVATTLDELWRGEMAACRVGGKGVLLVNIEGEIHAYADVCPHMRTPLSEGTLVGVALTCATHGWVFDVSCGRGINPVQACLIEFASVVRGNEVLVDVDPRLVSRNECLWSEKNA
jgi:toluene monooxygenase system ferredoxin subunit